MTLYRTEERFRFAGADRHAPCRARDTRLRRTDAGPARSDPAAASRARPAGAGGNRHRQDGGVRAADRPAVDAKTPAPRRATRALVLVPTRELAMQVAEAIHKYAQGHRPSTSSRSTAARRWSSRSARCERGVDIVVATPGRALDHSAPQDAAASTRCSALVLDEADEMLDMGFAEDLEAILEATPPTRQTALFSATMPPRIAAIADAPLEEPGAGDDRARKADGRQDAAGARRSPTSVARAQKAAALARLLDVEDPTVGARVLPHARRSRRSSPRR